MRVDADLEHLEAYSFGLTCRVALQVRVGGTIFGTGSGLRRCTVQLSINSLRAVITSVTRLRRWSARFVRYRFRGRGRSVRWRGVGDPGYQKTPGSPLRHGAPAPTESAIEQRSMQRPLRGYV